MPHIADTGRDLEQPCSGDVSYSFSAGADFDHPDTTHYHPEAASAPSGSSISYWASHSYHCRAPCPSWADYWRCRDICLSHQLTSIILPISDHLHTLLYVFPLWNPIFLVLYSGIGCMWPHLVLYYFNSSTHIFYCFFEACGFSYTSQTSRHSGGTTSSLFFNRFVTLRTMFSLVRGRVEEESFCY